MKIVMPWSKIAEAFKKRNAKCTEPRKKWVELGYCYNCGKPRGKNVDKKVCKRCEHQLKLIREKAKKK